MRELKEEIIKGYYKNVAYPIYQFKYGYNYGYNVIKILNLLNKTQWQPEEKLSVLRTKKLRKLIEHVYENVPYYREIMGKKNIRPDDIKSVEDINRFPILSKKIIKANFNSFVSKDVRKRKIINATTGGSTGEPLKYIRDRDTLIWTEATTIRGMSWAKYKLGNVLIDFRSAGWPTLSGKIREKIVKRYSFPAFSKNDEVVNYMNRIKLLHPFSILGYASNLYRIATICHRNSINDIHIPVIFSTAEMLYDYQRDLLEKQFNGEVFDYYGCNEVGSIAYECQYHNKHISDERLIIETTDSKGNQVDNTLGEVTITDLDNYAMPFIRYKNGDAAVISSEVCACGRSLNTIKSLGGRTQEFLTALDGNYVPAIFFPSRFREINGIDQYQIIQHDVNNITLKIVKNQFFSQDELKEIIGVIREMVGSVEMHVEVCKNIPPTSRGKTRLVISHLPANISGSSPN